METDNEFEVIEQDYEECEYCDRSYYEYDTGYAEYECGLCKDVCYGGDYACPLSFKYKVENDV